MNFKGIRLIVFFMVFSFGSVLAQMYKCGTTQEDLRLLKEQMLRNREEMRGVIIERSVVTYVPVRFFLVAKNGGTDRPSETVAFRALCQLNQFYTDQNIQFYLKEFKYLNNSTISTNPQSNSAFALIKSQMTNNYNSINIFIVNEIGRPDVAAYHQGPPGTNGNDWIVVAQQFAGDNNTLLHEVGHFFSLPHPFNGWDHDPWDPTIHGNPVGLIAPDGITKNEFVNGSNCDTAGDAICDTPADYLFGPSLCQYTLDAKDPNGQLLAPDIQNIMNYFQNCQEYHFTPNQKTEISNSLFSSSRNYVRPSYMPNTASVTGTPTLVSPASNVPVPTYNHVELKWSEVQGADRYLVELSNSASGTQRFFSNTNSLILTNLSPNTGYIWKVMAYNEYSTCGSFSGTRILKTGDLANAVEDSSKIGSWSVLPNPVKNGSSIFINVESVNGVEATVSLFAVTGRKLASVKDHKFPSGVSTLEIPLLHDMSAGIYLVTIQSENVFSSKRLAVTE